MNNELRNHFVSYDCPFVEGDVYGLKKDFSLKAPLRSARLLLSGLGMYDAYLNGKKVGEQMFKPGYTYYKKRVLFQEYEVTSLLKEKNEFFLYVGQGWFCGRFFCENTVQNYALRPSVSYLLSLEYEDGTQEVIASNPGDSAYRTEYVYAGEYDGEVVDFSRSDLGKEIGVVQSEPLDSSIQLEPTLTEVRLQEAMKFRVLCKGESTVLDLGQNFAGLVSIDPEQLQEGQTITLIHGEILDENGHVYTENLRAAKARIVYTRGKEKKKYTPKFTYMGFRYVEVLGLREEEDLEKLFSFHPLHTEMIRTGHFHSDNNDVNRLYQNLCWSQRSNYVEVPTDCPQRDERLGYTGDGHVFARTGTYNYDTRSFWHNFFRDLDLGQEDNPDGNVPPYLPQVGPKPVGFMSMQGWGSAVSIIPEVLYEQYGDFEFFASQYEPIKRYVDMEIQKAGKKNLWKAISLGDWLSLGKGVAWQAMNNHPVSNAFFVKDLKVLVRLAHLLGKREDEEKYARQLEKTKQAYIHAYIRPNGKVAKDYQGTYVLALRHVLEPTDALYPIVAKRFIQNVKKHGLQTGFFGTQHLLPLLAELGETKLAYDVLLSPSCPGWMYQIHRGATSIWERWDAIQENGKVNESKMSKTNMVSFNHYSFGAVGEFYYAYILGIQPLKPGYEEIRIAPKPDERLGNVEGSYDSVRGKIKVSYAYQGDSIRFHILTPSKTLFVFPRGEKKELEPGEYDLIQPKK